MARRMIDHACLRCGAVRKVSPDKLAKGLQQYCRKCQGPVAAEKRRAAMLKRGGPRSVTYGTCKECMRLYEMAAIDDSGYCTSVCLGKAKARGRSRQEIASSFINRLWRPRPPAILPRWEQLALFKDKPPLSR